MGCFLSKKQLPTKAEIKNCAGAPPPPPPPLEEEAVKEVVLSETIIFKKPTLIEDTVLDNKKTLENQELKADFTAEITQEESTAEITQKESTAKIKPCEDLISEVSELSELCSYTESFSTTTTATATAPEKRDDGEEVTQRSPKMPRRKRPNNGDMIGLRERNARSPARRQSPSLEKRKPIQGKGISGPRRNYGPINGPRREGGDVSARRSRSPVTRGNAMYKSPGKNETGRTVGRSPARTVENSRMGNEVQNDNVPKESNKIDNRNDNVSEEISESLENPLVSLECFIFL